MYKVDLSREAQRFYQRSDKSISKNSPAVSNRWKLIPEQANNVKALKGPLAGAYRYRIGDLRVVYTINDQAITVFVITIAKRSDVYE